MIHNHFCNSFPKVSMGQLNQCLFSWLSFMQHFLLLCSCVALCHHGSHGRRESNRQFILCYHFRATFDNRFALLSCHFALFMNFYDFFYVKNGECVFACLWPVFVMAHSTVKSTFLQKVFKKKITGP